MKYQYIVCSDLASRGLDIQNIDVVLSIDVPNNTEYYFHRAGRTGRFDKIGESFIFYNADSQNNIRRLISNGLSLNFIKFGDDNTFVETKPIDYKKTYKSTAKTELQNEINKIRRSGSKKVKPGYKKKIEQEVQRAKSRHRREIIKKDIRRQREERYKRAAKDGK
jgi:ATP-dependent RNA helicase CshB